MKSTRIIAISALLIVLAVVNRAWSDDEVPQPAAPLKGSVVLAGGDDVPMGVLQAVVRLAGGSKGRIAIVVGRGDKADFRWQRIDTAAADVVEISNARDLRDEDTLTTLLSATGIWLAGDLDEVDGNVVFERLLQGVVERGGVAGGRGAGARALARMTVGRDDVGFDVLPQSVVAPGYMHDRDEGDLLAALEANPGCVGWGIPAEAALVIHDGRRVCAIGEGAVTARVAPRDGWSGRTEHFETALFIERWDELPYDLDFLAWTRSAQLRTQPVFPPETAPVPELERGTLIINGGRRVTDDVWERFIDAAGGTNATFVCIPSASDQDEYDLDSYSADNLGEHGCENVFVRHTHDRDKANDAEFAERLREATGVWMDGGRTYRLMDAIQHTTIHQLILEVLARGGVVGGSSAGAQAVGDFLMRGNPRTNNPLWCDGYQTGLGLLAGVIIDAHFRQRDRQHTFPDVMETFPQMLGIGLDENTTLMITGHTAEVVGENAVTFFDYRGDQQRDDVLHDGERYDLKARERIGD